MKKHLISVSVGAGVIASLIAGVAMAYAIVTTNAGTYSPPATVTYNIAETSTLVLYSASTGDLVCYTSSQAPGNHDLAGTCSSGGSFSSASSTVGSYALLAGTDATCATDGLNYSACQRNSATYSEADFQITAAVPSVAMSDLGGVGGSILSAVVTPTEYVLQTFGPPLFVLMLLIALFFAIYHRAKTGRWL